MAALAAALAVAASAAAQVTLEAISFGAGDCHRPGDFTGVRLAATSGLDEPITAELVFEIEDANGDLVEYGREVALQPGQRVERWLYPRLLPSARPDLAKVYGVRAFRIEDGRRAREIGAARITAASGRNPSFPVGIAHDLILVLGDRRLGLDPYAIRGPNLDEPIALNCLTHLGMGLDPRDLPDRWPGLASAQAIVWADPARLPTQLSGDQAEALRGWVRRGGTLVLSIPETQDIWALGRRDAHPLSDLLDGIVAERIDAVPVRDLLPVLSKNPQLRDPAATTRLATFDPDRLPGDVRPLVALPSRKAPVTGFPIPRSGTLDAKVIAVERRIGHGRVVLVGIDLDALNARALQPTPLPQADVFWNRVLGRRGDTPSVEDATRLLDADPPRATARIGSSDLGGGLLVATEIGMRGRAAIGVLAAVGLFGTYWLVAGPLGFVVLRRFGLERLSWVAFVGVALLFTALAWSGGRTLGRSDPRIRHLTVVDFLAAEGGASSEPGASAPTPRRVHAWFSAYLPGYGPTTVAAGGEGDPGDLLASWSPPPDGSGERFPSPDRSRVPFDAGATLVVPARSTTSDFSLSRLGSPDPDWGRGPTAAAPIELRIDRTVEPPALQLAGSLVHALPGPLENVAILLVTPFRTPLPANLPGPLPVPSSATSGEPPSFAALAVVPRWAPGVPLDLARDLFGGQPIVPRSGGEWSFTREARDRYYRPLQQQGWGFRTGETTVSADARRRGLESLGLYWMLQPPPWTALGTEAGEPIRSLRLLGRELDLSSWFLRPCLVVVGFLPDTRSPVPILVDGERAESDGLTVVRWICPLAAPWDGIVPPLGPAARE